MLPCAEACLCSGLMDGLDQCSSPPLPEAKVEPQRGEDGAACLWKHSPSLESLLQHQECRGSADHAVGVPLRVVQQQRRPERENLERQEQQLSVIDMGPVSYTLSVFINKMHSETHGHQTKHSKGQSLRTAQEAILL